MDRHPFHWLISPQGDRVRIDREIAPLLTKMWQLGIRTTNSCQEHCSPTCPHKPKKIKYSDGSVLYTHTKTKSCGNRIWIVFETAKSLEKFYNYVAVWAPYAKKGEPFASPEMHDIYHDIVDNCSQKYYPDSWERRDYICNWGIELSSKRIPATQASGEKVKTIGILTEVGCKKNNFKIMPQLYIPRKHLSYVEERLDIALKKKK